MLWTRADLSFALVNNLELLTHYTKRAENERCFSRQNRDEKKTEMRKNIQVERNLHLQRGTAASYKLRASTGCASIFDHITSYCTYGNTKFARYSCESIVFTAVLKFKYYSR